MSFDNASSLSPLVFFQKNIGIDAANLGIDVRVTFNGNSVLYVVFKSQADMNLYKLSGNYAECTKIKFFLEDELK